MYLGITATKEAKIVKSTQFGRALQALDIQLICANTCQAKGRVERANKTLQLNIKVGHFVLFNYPTLNNYINQTIFIRHLYLPLTKIDIYTTPGKNHEEFETPF